MKMRTEADLNPELALQALIEMDLMAFTEFAFSVVRPGVLLKRNWHVDAVTYKLAQVAKCYIRRLIITLPPRSLKSLCASVALPAWFLGHYPWERVVVVSYSEFLSRTHANDFRRVVSRSTTISLFPCCCWRTGTAGRRSIPKWKRIVWPRGPDQRLHDL